MLILVKKFRSYCIPVDQPVRTPANRRLIVRDRRNIQSQNADIVLTRGAEVEIEIRKTTKPAEAIPAIERSVVIVLVRVDRILPIVAKGK